MFICLIITKHPVDIATVPKVSCLIFITITEVWNSNLYQETPQSVCLISITCHGKNFCFQIQHFNLVIICVCNIHQATVFFNTQTSWFIEGWLGKAGTNNIACFSCACQGGTVLHLGIHNLNLRSTKTQKASLRKCSRIYMFHIISCPTFPISSTAFWVPQLPGTQKVHPRCCVITLYQVICPIFPSPHFLTDFTSSFGFHSGFPPMILKVSNPQL